MCDSLSRPWASVQCVLRERILFRVLTVSRQNITHTWCIAPLPGSPNNVFISSSVYADSLCQSVAYSYYSNIFITIVHQLMLSCYERRLIVFIVQDIQINISIQILLSLLFRFYYILVIGKTISPGMCVDSCICIGLYWHICNVS